jgi:hypothetical protein
VLLVAMHLAVLLVFTVPWRWQLLALGLGSYTLRMWAITAGYHRYFSHRAFKTSRAFQFLLGLLVEFPAFLDQQGSLGITLRAHRHVLPECHGHSSGDEPRETSGEQRSPVCGGGRDTDDQAGGGDDAIVGTQHPGP